MRKVIPFNENWSFRKEDTGLPLTLPADWETVTLPHTWNAVDGQDGKGSYYRGACWYAKECGSTVSYIVNSPVEKLYTFTVTPPVLQELGRLAAYYCRQSLDGNFKSLEILKSL